MKNTLEKIKGDAKKFGLVWGMLVLDEGMQKALEASTISGGRIK